MHDNQIQEHSEYERTWVSVCDAFAWRGWRRPRGAEDAGFDCGVNFCGVGRGVGHENFTFELREHVADFGIFVVELDAEEALEEGDELWGDVALEGGHVGKGEELADGLCALALVD